MLVSAALLGRVQVLPLVTCKEPKGESWRKFGKRRLEEKKERSMIVQISFRYLREIFLSASSCCQELDLNSRLIGGKKNGRCPTHMGGCLNRLKVQQEVGTQSVGKQRHFSFADSLFPIKNSSAAAANFQKFDQDLNKKKQSFCNLQLKPPPPA